MVVEKDVSKWGWAEASNQTLESCRGVVRRKCTYRRETDGFSPLKPSSSYCITGETKQSPNHVQSWFTHVATHIASD